MADKTDDMMKQTAKELSDAGLLRMYNSEQKSIAEGNNTPYHQRRMQATEEELQARLDSYSQLESFELGDLDNIIAMASAVGLFSENAKLAQEVLAKAQAQKASLTPEQLNEAALEAMMKDSSYNKNDLDVALDAGTQYNQEISGAKQQTTENVQPETKEDGPYRSHFDEVVDDATRQRLDSEARQLNRAQSRITPLSYEMYNNINDSEKLQLNDHLKINYLEMSPEARTEHSAMIDKYNEEHAGSNKAEELGSFDQIQWGKRLIPAQVQAKDGSTTYVCVESAEIPLSDGNKIRVVKEENGQYSYTVLDKDDKVISTEYGLDPNAIIGKLHEHPELANMSAELDNVQAAQSGIEIVEHPAETEGLTPSDDQILTEMENLPEDKEELRQFDLENGIEAVTQEQLEANDKILDNIQDPLAIDKDGKLINPEFAQEVQALNNLTITDDNGKDLSQEDQNSARLDLIAAAQLEAETEARACGNGNEEEVKKLYNERFKEALQRNIVAAAFASSFQAGMSDEQMRARFQEAVNNPQKTSLSAVRAVTNHSSAKSEKIVDRLKAKFKSIPVVQKMENKIKAFDATMTEKYGKKWEVGKRFAKAALKSAKNVAIYSLIGGLSSAAAPYAFAALAVKSGYDAVKSLQKEAKKNNMSFWQFAKANKGKVALAFTTTGLSLAGSALGLSAGSGMMGAEAASKIQPALRTASRVLAVGSKAAPAVWHSFKAAYKRFKGDKEGAKDELKLAKESWTQTAEAAIGIFVGMEVGDKIAESRAAAAENQPQSETPTASDNMQMSPAEMAQTLEQMGLNPDIVDSMSPQAMQQYIMTHPEDYQAAQMMMQDKDGDGIADAIDPDHGQGWATANETQLDRLMDADPAKVNALLNDGQWHSSAELKEMMENGQFNDEQLKGIHELATREFDENGHIIDPELREYYENLAREAAAREAAQEELMQSEEPLNNVKDQEPVYYQPEMTPEEQRAYDEILNLISRGEDMTNPEVRASVEGLAQIHLQDIKEAIARGDNLAIAEKIAALHNQGEDQEIALATRENEEDSRRLRNAKEDVLEAKSKLDAAREALAQDPDNEKLQKEVEKLEKKFNKESLDLEQRDIKESASEVKDQLKQDERAYKDIDKSYQTIQQNFGLTEEQVNQGLAAMGIDINNLPQDTSSLSEDAQKLITAHNMYEQVHQNEEDLKSRIAVNRVLLDDLENLEEQSKADEKDVKRGQGLSAEAEERLPGHSNIENSEILASVQEMISPSREAEQPQVMQEAEMRVAGVDPEPTVYKPEEKGIEDVEVIHESDIQRVDSRIGEITYHLDEKGNYNVGGNISVAKDMTSYNMLQSGMMQKDMAENPDMEMTNAYQTKLQMKSMEVMLRNEIYTDLQNRLNLGEEVPGAQEFMQKHEEELRNLGLSRDEHGGIGRIADEQQRTTQQTEERPVERAVENENKVEEKPVEKEEKVEEKPVEKSEEKIMTGALSYGFTAEGDLNFNGNVAINEDSEAYKVAKEAIMASNNKNDAIFGSMFQNDETGAELDTHNLVIANEVYSNLQQQEAEGTVLSAEEKMFIHKHEQKLADLGLGRDENGNICKAENAPQQTAEKPVEKEEKTQEVDSSRKAQEDRIRQVAQIYGKRNGLEGEALQEFIDKEVKEHMPQEQQSTPEPVVAEAPERHTIESKMGVVSYSIDKDGTLEINRGLSQYSGSKEDRIIHAELTNDILDHKYGEDRETTTRVQRMSSENKATVAMGYQMVYEDIHHRLEQGETIPGADKALQLIDKHLETMGLKLDEKGELTATDNKSDTKAYKELKGIEDEKRNIFQKIFKGRGSR